jgi:hypothetical protein
MKRYIAIIAVVTILIVWFFLSRTGMFDSDKGFAVHDIDGLTRIELAEGDTRVVLSKSDKQWYVYDLPANPDAVKALLRILSDVEIRYPMPKLYEQNFSTTILAEKGLHLRVYKKENCIREYYLMFPDTTAGCIGLISGKKQIYCLSIPGLSAESVSAKMSVKSEYWQENLLFSLHPDEILSVKVYNSEHPEESFTIQRSDTIINIMDINGVSVPFDKNTATGYLSYFVNVSFEHYANLSVEERQNLMLSDSPYTLSVETGKGTREYKALYIYEASDKTDDYGEPLIYNRNYFYLALPDEKIVLAKWLNFDILFKNLTEFAAVN